MRIKIRHETTYHYDAPINGVIQTLRIATWPCSPHME